MLVTSQGDRLQLFNKTETLANLNVSDFSFLDPSNSQVKKKMLLAAHLGSPIVLSCNLYFNLHTYTLYQTTHSKSQSVT